MAKFQADVWLGQASGEQRVTVSSNTWNGARQQIMRIYGVNEGDVHNLRECRESSNSSGDTDYESLGVLAIVLFVLWAILEYWMIILPVSIIVGILAIIYYFNNDED